METPTPSDSGSDSEPDGTEPPRRRKRKNRNRKGLRYQKRNPHQFFDSPGFLLLDLACPAFKLSVEVVPSTRLAHDPATSLPHKDGIALAKERCLKRMGYRVVFVTEESWRGTEDKESFLRLACVAHGHPANNR